MSEEEEGEKKEGPAFIETAGVVVSWFVLNIAIGSSTKWIFVAGQICSQKTCVVYKFPVAITVPHMKGAVS